MNIKTIALIFFILFFGQTHNASAQYQMEKLDRGVVAVRTGTNNFISWRWLGTEDDISFNLYRNGTKVNANPLTVCNYTDNGAAANAVYTVKAIVNSVEQTASNGVTPWAQQYMKVLIQTPPGGTTPDGVAYTYNANDASVADLDGDGAWEIILKWDPSNSKDNSQSGYTGNTYVDAYKLDGKRLWRIDYGKNIRSGAHYMDFMVYDFDGDGKAEMMCRTGDGTIDGTGKVIGNGTADYRTSAGYVLSGPEYMTVFNGQTGAAMATSNYFPARGSVGDWGDTYGNRVDRFKAAVAYVDGKQPTGVFIRGYYAKWGVAAWDWRNGALTQRWTYMCPNDKTNPCYEEGAHSVSVADVDGDGKQEIIMGSNIIDDNGTMYYNTQVGHGDALHVSDMDPDIAGIEISHIQEPVGDAGLFMYSGKDKRIMWKKASASGVSEGPGRGVCADISAAYKGAESWVVGGGITGVFDCKGSLTNLAKPASCNFLAWWDGDLLRELLNATQIDKFGTGRLLSAHDMVAVTSNNGTKSTPALSGDIFGDWREEVIWRASANDALYIFTTTTPSTYKIRTLMHDPQYRVAIAWQNTGYNQPPHLSYYLGEGMATPPKPNITIIGENTAPTINITAPTNNTSTAAPANISINATAADTDGIVSKVEFYNGATKLGEDLSSPYSYSWTNVAAGIYKLTARATDDGGSVTTSAEITVTVTNPNETPVVSITSPVTNTVVNGTPASITINATASDPNGTVTKVDFYNGATFLGSDNTAAYSYAWTNVPAGTYTLTAVATDNGGTTGTSAEVIISVFDLPSDCNGVQGGTATTDNCDRCIGGTTGRTACATVVEAEAACEIVGIEEAKNEGFSGAGYVNTDNAIGASFTFVIDAATTGTATLSFRYANGNTSNRAGQLTVNNVAGSIINFPGTGTWIDWKVVDAPVTLQAGSNSVKLVATTADGLANIDRIGFVSSGLSLGTCGVITGIETGEKEKKIQLFPNPSNTQFNLQLQERADVRVMNMHGVLIEEVKDVKGLQFGEEYAAGIYMLHINNNGTSKVIRIVKFN